MDDLDIRNAKVLMRLPMMWYCRMLHAHAELLEQLISDSSAPSIELRPRKTVIFTPEWAVECFTSSLQ